MYSELDVKKYFFESNELFEQRKYFFYRVLASVRRPTLYVVYVCYIALTFNFLSLTNSHRILLPSLIENHSNRISTVPTLRRLYFYFVK